MVSGEGDRTRVSCLIGNSNTLYPVCTIILIRVLIPILAELRRRIICEGDRTAGFCFHVVIRDVNSKLAVSGEELFVLNIVVIKPQFHRRRSLVNRETMLNTL